jgi:outer membrane protein
MFTPFLLFALAADSLTLSQAEAEALRHQPAVLQARGQTAAAEGRIEEARSGYLPQATLTGTYQRITGNFAQRPGQLPGGNAAALSVSTRTFNFYNFNVVGSQLIYDFGQTSHRWDAAEASRDASAASQESVNQQALLSVRRAYLLARAQRELVDVAADTVRNQEKHMQQIQGFVKVGIRPEIDLAQVRTALANAQVQLIGTQNNLAVSMAQLNQAMGLPAEVPHELADSEMPPVPGEDAPAGQLAEDAQRTRPEIAVAQQQRRAQELTVRSLEGGYLPSLSLIAGASEVGTEISNLVPNWYGGLAITWPFLLGGLTRGQVHEAKGTLAALDAQEQATRLQVRVDVVNARVAITAAKSSITAAGEALASAGDQLHLAEARYATGLGSVIELDDSQLAFTNARAQEVQARYGLSSARAQLVTAMGSR